MKILLIGASHGDELLGLQLYEDMLANRSELLEHVDFIVGNPRALVHNQRYIDADLNRSYLDGGNTYEARRATEIRQYIRLTHPDIVLDIHTTNCIQPNCLIVSNIDGEMKKRFLRASTFETVLQLSVGGDISIVGDNVIGYEIPNAHINKGLIDNILSDIQSFTDGHSPHTRKRLFKVSGKIMKKELTMAEANKLENFKPSKYGFIPIMVGENSYKRQTDYLGFKATLGGEVEV